MEEYLRFLKFVVMCIMLNYLRPDRKLLKSLLQFSCPTIGRQLFANCQTSIRQLSNTGSTTGKHLEIVHHVDNIQ